MSVADLTQAQLAREQWNRYRQSFAPILESMSKDLLSGESLKQSLALVPEQTSQAFDLQKANQEMSMQRMGLSGESESAKRQTDLAKASSQAGAENELRNFYTDLKSQAILGSSSSMNKQLTGGN